MQQEAEEEDDVAYDLTDEAPLRTVFDHLRELTPAAVDRLYGKGTSCDPEVPSTTLVGAARWRWRGRFAHSFPNHAYLAPSL